MYGTTAGVSSLVPSVGTLSTTSVPSQAQVTNWLYQASARIDRILGDAGYSVPVDTTAQLTQELDSIAELYAGAFTLMARGLDNVTGAEESRSVVWLKRVDKEIEALLGTDLTSVGATRASVAMRRRNIRTLQLRKVDGWSGAFADATTELDNVSD